MQNHHDSIISGEEIAPFASTSRLSVAHPRELSAADIAEANERLANAGPQEVLAWAIQNVPRLFQTTAFGLTGLAALDMISKLSPEGSTHPVPLIFINTLYHFPETLDLAATASQKYGAEMHVYMPPAAQSVAQFEAIYGERLWEVDEESYDFLVKVSAVCSVVSDNVLTLDMQVEPSRRAYEELQVGGVITGRRRSQGGDRASIPIVEVDETGLVKVNPLANWTFKDTKAYIDANGVPYNALLDRGYTSIGDWHSTKKPDGTSVKALSGDAAERSGRWAGRAEKTECGLHKDCEWHFQCDCELQLTLWKCADFKMRAAFNKKKREREQRALDEARGNTLEDGTLPEPVMPIIEHVQA